MALFSRDGEFDPAGIPAIGPLFFQSKGQAELIENMKKAAAEYQGARSTTARNYTNTLGHMFNAYNGGQSALQAMYGTTPMENPAKPQFTFQAPMPAPAAVVPPPTPPPDPGIYGNQQPTAWNQGATSGGAPSGRPTPGAPPMQMGSGTNGGRGPVPPGMGGIPKKPPEYARGNRG